MFGRLMKGLSPALKKAVAASALGKKSAAVPGKAAAAPRGVVAKAVSVAAKQAAGRGRPFKNGGAVKKSSDVMGRAVKRKTADVKGRAMKKGK
jgi:hypothetical protein